MEVSNNGGATKAPPIVPRRLVERSEPGNRVAALSIPFDRWAGMEFPEPPALARGLLHQGITIIGGAPGSLKTWLLHDMILSVASGAPILGQYPVVEPGPVLYIAYEGNQHENRNRLVSMAAAKGLAPVDVGANLCVIWRQDQTQMDDPRWVSQLAAVASQYRVIAIDVLRDCWSGDENDNMATRRFNHECLQPIVRTGCSVILTHHARKVTGDGKTSPFDGLRGSGAWHGIRDSLIVLQPVNAGVSEPTKSKAFVQVRDGVPVDGFTIQRPAVQADGKVPAGLTWAPEEGGRPTVDRSDRADRILRFVESNPGCTRNAVKRSGGDGNINVQVLDELLKSGRVENRGDAKTHRFHVRDTPGMGGMETPAIPGVEGGGMDGMPPMGGLNPIQPTGATVENHYHLEPEVY